MAKQRKHQTGSLKLVFAEVVINGHRMKGVDYRRVQYSDGSVKESGLPAGMKSNPSIGELLEHAFRK